MNGFLYNKNDANSTENKIAAGGSDEKVERRRDIVEWAIAIAVVAALAILIFIAIGGARARERDARRLADMTFVRQAFELINDAYGNYGGSFGGCAENGKLNSVCAVKSVSKYFSSASGFNDPSGSVSCCDAGLDVCRQSVCDYCFDEYSGDKKDYRVYFHLEKGVAGLGSDGCYQLTKDGIAFVGKANN